MQARRSHSVSTRLFLSLAILFSTFAAISSHAERVEDLQKPTNWVADFAHVLSPEAAARIDSLCGNLSHSKANAQIEVVTIKSLDGDDIDDFTSRLEEKWKIGKKGSDRGVLMLFAIQEHKRRIEVGHCVRVAHAHLGLPQPQQQERLVVPAPLLETKARRLGGLHPAPSKPQPGRRN